MSNKTVCNNTKGENTMQNFKPNKELLTTEYAKNWTTDRMINHCVNSVSAMATLPTGEIITVDKQGIETRFCFDDSFDYEGAQKMSEYARTSTEYFKRENMEYFNRWINDLKDDNYRLVISIKNEYGREGIIKSIRLLRYWEEDNLFRQATEEEKEIILALYEYARDKHEKKVDAYLKRYGTSKVHSWTYWGMA